MTDVPPGARCGVDGCEARAEHPEHPAPRCEDHVPTGGNAGGDATAEDDTTPVAERSGRRFYPDWIQARDWWIDWVLAYPYNDGEVDWDAKPTKQPVAPYWNGTADTVRWNFDLPGDEHPCTDFATVDRWEGWGVGDEVPAPDRVVSDEIGTGIIIPRDQSDHATVTLLDWDDVRDPETGEIHPVAAGALEAVDAYAEVSQSGEGIHQFVFGEIPGGLRKFIRHVDEQPFVGDDRPQIEMYQSGRVCAMTGEHVAGSGEDVAKAQDLVDELCWRFGTASNNAPGTPTDPFATERGDAGGVEATTSSTPAVGEADVPDHEDVAEQMREATAYDGPAPADWDVPEDRSVEYHGVLLARERSDQLASVANWELIGYAAALGARDGLTKDQVKDDLREHPTPGYGYDDSRAEKEVGSVYRKADNGGYAPPSTDRLVERGILPEVLTEDDAAAAELSPEDVLDADTTLDRHEAWRAAGAVSPGDLDGAVGLDAVDGGWRCPTCGDHVDDVVRAAGLAEGALDCCGDPFDDAAEYDRLYASLREDRGAPLPEYIPPTQAVEDADRARGATEALRGWHLLDGLDSTVTTEDPSGGDAVAEIDPTWEDSNSGERIVLFSSGLFYCREHERVLWPLQVVGLEQGLLDDEDDWLQGQAWLRAYALARTEYDAPLPPIVWNGADEAPDPLYLPVLPDAEDLLGEGVTTDGGALDEARQAVADLYTDEVATDSGARNHLLTVLPALGKSYNAVLQAADQPTLYTAKRLELRKEAADRAREHDVDCMHLPTLGETRPPEKVLGAVASHVREHGRSALRDREALLEVAEDVYHQVDEYWPAYEDAYGGDDEGGCEDAEHDHSVDPHTVAAGDPCPGCGGTFDTTSATRRHVTRCDAVGEDDSVDLDRAACGCGDGEHGPEWQLAFWTARKLGEKPRDLHVRGETIFDDTPPCCEDDCPYTVAWDRAADPDRPVDLLIGHPVHAYVSGARTRPERTDDDDVYVEDRVVALDEFPGDVYTRKFGDEYLQHARWLAGCLSPAVEDTTDLLDHRRELWRDDTVAAWLDGEASPAVLDALEAKREQAEDDDADNPDWSALLEADLDVDGDLAALVRRAVRAAADPDRDAEDLLDTATTALRGGREGADALASGAEDGYAHPDAYWLLLALLAPDGTDGGDADPEGEGEGEGEGDHMEDWRATVTAETRDAEHFDLGSDNGRMKAVTVGDRQRFLLDRDHAGAVLLLPPDLEDNTVAGLDATGRPELWEIALGAEFATTDIHETAAERRAFLRDVLNLRVVQTTPHVHTYSGDPTGKNFGDDVALVDAVADQYGQHQLAQDRLTTTSAPAVVTTKKVEDYVGGDLVDAGAARVDHYGDLIGSNRLDEHSVGVILGAEHYGHDAAEKWALLAGEEFEATGHGTDLDYTSDAANALLRRMRDDQVMQSIMRFGRDEEGAVVFAHTAALREDLPVVEDGDVAEAWTQNQQAIAKAAADRQGQPFDVASVAEDDDVDCHRRTVRRVLNQFADLGYLQADRGHATEYSVEADPGTGQVDLDTTPELAGGGAGGGGVGGDSGQAAYENTNTWFVWSCDADRGDQTGDHGETVRLGPPRGTARSAPPG